MDLQSAFVCVLVFVVSAAILLLISMFGMKEKSYEEALAEQRKLTSSLLGTNQRPKPKEKKQKKTGKKVKEKLVSNVVENEPVAEYEHTDNSTPEIVTEIVAAVNISSTTTHSLHHATMHVEFEEPALVAVTPPILPPKKRSKKEKARSILLNKEKSPITDVDVSKALPVNHFETIHPKDEFELLHLHNKEDVSLKHDTEAKVKPLKIKQAVIEPDQQKTSKNNKVQKQQPVVEEVPTEAVTVVKATTVVHQSVNSAKDKKKKKSEFNTLQQMAGADRPGVNVSLLVPLVRKADLSRSEIQILIDLLLNKQHETPAILDEWSEGKADPVQKLKKQLAEKDRALTEGQEAMIGVQAKLREIRAELNSERSRHLQNCRNLEENLHTKHTEMQSILARHHTQNQKMQQMQAQLNEEILTARKLREEHNAIQLQRQQLEMHLASFNDQQQEAEASFQAQLSQSRVDLQEQQNVNAQLNIELHALREKSHAEKEMLHERIRQIDSQAVHYKNEFDQKQDLARQLEESHRMYGELEHSYGVSHRNENELKVLCQQHLEEARRLEMSQGQTHEELNRLQLEVARVNSVNKQQQEEQDKLISQLRLELTTLQNEKAKLEVANGAAAASKFKEVEVLNLQNELVSLQAQLQETESQLTTELETTRKSVKEMERQLEAQRSKNDEIKKKIKLEEDENNRKFLQRLFPDLNIPSNEQWMSSAEKIIKVHMSTLESSVVPLDNSAEVSKLQLQIAHYRTIIDDTEGILNKLQVHVEQEERNWRKEIEAKDAKIEELKEISRKQLQVNIGELELKLAEEQQQRLALKTEYDELYSRIVPVTNNKQTQIENLAEKEKVIEDNTRLSEELFKEQKRCHDMREEMLRWQSEHPDSLHLKNANNN